ncbi:MAG: hypothetical protein GY757_55030, partial [bacterium]|nr:hypothetical protein [bacterium]
MPGLFKRHEVRYTWIVAFMVTTLAWMVTVGIIVTEKRLDGHEVHYGAVIMNEISGAYTMLVLLPAVLWG